MNLRGARSPRASGSRPSDGESAPSRREPHQAHDRGKGRSRLTPLRGAGAPGRARVLLARLIGDERGAIGSVRTSVRELGNMRTDRWWVEPVVTVSVLAGFVVYATFGAFWPHYYYAEPYLSPMYSPCIASSCEHVTFGPLVGSWWPLSPALLILPFPLLFRLTCYYYRKAYYRAFWWSPPACAVADARDRYTGETRPPLILQNLHRYAFYLAVPYPFILLYDAILGTRFDGGFGIGLGTVILFVNAVLLGTYTLSCHSCRHLCGGHLDTFSRAPLRHRFWKLVTRLNERHMQIAWMSLVFVAFTDLYVRLVAAGVIADPRLV